MKPPLNDMSEPPTKRRCLTHRQRAGLVYEAYERDFDEARRFFAVTKMIDEAEATAQHEGAADTFRECRAELRSLAAATTAGTDGAAEARPADTAAKPRAPARPFTKDEDAVILAEGGAGKWAGVASKLAGRTAESCRKRLLTLQKKGLAD